MSKINVTVEVELAAVHERLYRLVQMARLAESYHRAKNASRLAVALEDAERLARVPFAPRVEDALNRLKNAKGVLEIPGSGGVSANSYTQLLIAVNRTVRNTIVDRYLDQFGDVEIETSQPVPGSDYPLTTWPVGITWEQIARLLVADSKAAIILAGWRVACERLAPRLQDDVSAIAFEDVWVYMLGVGVDTSESAEMMADAMDTGWRPEADERGGRTTTEDRIAVYEHVRGLFRPGFGIAKVAARVQADPTFRTLFLAAGGNPDNSQEVEGIVDAARTWTKNHPIESTR